MEIFEIDEFRGKVLSIGLRFCEIEICYMLVIVYIVNE